MGTTGQPSWRDVYELSKEMRTDLSAHRQETREELVKINERLSKLEDANTFKEGESSGEKRVFGVAKSTLAMAISLVGAAVAVVAGLNPPSK